MRPRYLEPAIAELCFADHKMAFVSGPRQVGKTVMARRLLAQRGAGIYHNWDDVTVRRQWAKDPRSLVPTRQTPAGTVPLVVFDEIHKARQWKRSLKGVYDTLESPADIIVTGSARLSVYRRGSDSLVGRYYHFRLHPFTSAELLDQPQLDPDAALQGLFDRTDASVAADASTAADAFERLLRLGGFPEPFLTGSERTARLWRRGRVERVIREDLRDLSRVPELSRVEMLASLLPERVGAPLSRAALREILEVSFDTVRRWLAALDELYYFFELKPFQRAISRTLRKDGKVYLWDWVEVEALDRRLENLVASHLLKLCHFFTDTGYGAFDLWYLRTKDGHEIDFLVTRDGRPWLPVEVKLRDTSPSPSWGKFLPHLHVSHALQLIHQRGYRREYQLNSTRLLVANAADVLAQLV